MQRRQGAMPTSFTIAKVRNIPIRVHWSLLLILPYMAVMLSMRFDRIAHLAGVRPEHLALSPLLWGAALTLALLVSIVLHELAHSLVAIRFGGRVRAITLMLMGGVSEIERFPRRPRNEALMAAVGPATSLGLALVLWLVHGLATHGSADPRMGLFYLAQINLALGLFNLLPAFPMDGGRVLRALLASRLGMARATEVAARVGRVSAVLLGLLGVLSANFILLLIALYLYGGAGEEARAERARALLGALKVGEVALRAPATVDGSTSVAAAAERMGQTGREELVVVDAAGAPLGLVRMADLARLGRRGPDTPLGALREEISAATVMASPSDSLFETLERMGESGAASVLVLEGGQLLGALGREEISRTLSLKGMQESGRAGPRRPAHA